MVLFGFLDNNAEGEITMSWQDILKSDTVGPNGFYEIERLSPPTGKGPGLVRFTAYSGTPKKPIDVLEFMDVRSGSGMERAHKKMRKLVGL